MILKPATAADPDVVALTTAQQAEIAARYLPDEEAGGYPLDDTARYLVAYTTEGQPIACGAIQTLPAAPAQPAPPAPAPAPLNPPTTPTHAELKRMFVHPAHRGRGLARRLLAALEDLARAEGHHTLSLETGTRQAEAIGLYTTAGYAEIPLFGHYAGSTTSVCFSKSLV
ncbi:GNAT family N-acetyltransferase [Longispora albida]|uniref:GNAT family N-acetyltransferase n=1 Tax=Longispora albida TaxID=203523 RepID=UPI00037877D5|nr:GNAT family N-acetyltransferase [Longispora albida]